MTTAYGFVDLQHLFNTRINEVGVERIYTAVQESAAEHNRVINGLLETFVERTTKVQEQFELPGDGTLQPLDENGVPLPVKPSGSYQVAYPIQGGGTAWGGNRVARALMNVREANRHTVDSQTRDADWLRRHIIAALLTNTSWTFEDKAGRDGSKGLGSITIQPLANGDAVTYVRTGGQNSTDNHYGAQAAAIDDANNPFPAIRKDLTEHPSNSGPVVVYVASNLTDSIEGLAGFVPISDPDVQEGANSDRLVSSLARGFGDEVLGKTNKCWIIEWGALPDGYMIAHASGAGPVLGMREYDAEELQGFFTENYSTDGAHTQTSMIRYAGFGVQNRVAAYVYQVGNATYQIPAAFSAPLDV